ncbi:hypothetical protein K474DRAFT_1667817 [Panus rudis PR-1116 ss-1]|nr:hypothetical protein K474DRAFT_1667817 [Panus rudis PR-1116 ss-1]
MLEHLWLSLWLICLFPHVSGQANLIPLAIRSPHFNSWVVAPPQNHWPGFWNGRTWGWNGLIRVDGQAYQWLGANGLGADQQANLTDTKITPTKSIFTMQIATMDVTITFFSPIEPSDPVRQSMPFSYVSLEAKSRDNSPHNVDVYCDVSGEWLSSDNTQLMTWNSTTTSTSTFHQINLQKPVRFQETGDQADDVALVLAMRNSLQLNLCAAIDVDCRSSFEKTGIASGTLSSPQPIAVPFPVFGISVSLGNITSTSDPVTWAIGVIRDPSIQYTLPDNVVQQRSPYYVTSYPTISSAVDAFLSDFKNAQQRSQDFEQKVNTAAGGVSTDVLTLTSLAARHVMGSTDLTISKGRDGKWNTSDVMAFMKDIGVSRRVNPVEAIYAAYPFFLFVNATYAGYLLAPLLEYQDSPQYTLPYAMRDLGLNYPVAEGSNNPHGQQIEQSANMLIMTLAQARASGDGTLIGRHYDLLHKWADYIVSFNVTPPDTTTVDLEAQANTTNLIIKGIIGVKAMAMIASAAGRADDEQRFENFASSFAGTWKSLAQASDGHLLSSFGADTSSWAQIYNLYADRLLQTQVVDNSIYDIQTQFYEGQLATSGSRFGLPLDSDTNGTNAVTNAAWTMFTASVTTNTTFRDSIIAPVLAHAQQASQPFPLLYKVGATDPLPTGGVANPASGAVYAPLALSLPAKAFTVPPVIVPSGSKSSNIGPIVGGVVGGVVFLALIVGGVLLWLRRRRRQQYWHTEKNLGLEALPTQPPVVPYTDLTLVSAGSGESSSALVPPGRAPPSGKAREAMGYNGPTPERTPPQSVPSAYSSVPSSSQEPPTSAGSTRISQSEVQGLRMEVENLRRVMQEIQADRMEAPPSYAD